MVIIMKITKKEAAKVTKDINDIWYARFEGEDFCVIYTHSHESNSPSYAYYFINHGFNEYEFIGKLPTADRR